MKPWVAVTRHGIRSWWKEPRAVILGLLAPIFLFLIFTLVFTGTKTNSPVFTVGWADLDKSEVSSRFSKILKNEGVLHIVPMSEQALKTQMAQGPLSLGIFIEPGFQNQVMHLQNWGKSFLHLYYDPSQPTGKNVLQGLITKANFLLISESWGNADEQELLRNSALTSKQRQSVLDLRRAFSESQNLMQSSGKGSLAESLIPITSESVHDATAVNPFAAQQLAGVAVIFLLFSVMRSGSMMLEERASGTLTRILTAPVSVYQWMMGKLCSISFNGAIQVGLMCLAGWIFFRVPIFKSPVALAAMVIATVLCAASFGLIFTTFCHTSEQVHISATLFILTMSLLGGSMVPASMLPQWAQKLSVFTLNGWAMKGFTKVLVHGQGFFGILPELSALLLIAGLLLAITLSLLPLPS